MSGLLIEQLHFQRSGKTLLFVDHAEFRPGEIVAVLGPNGAGKSTLLKILASQWFADSGSVCLHGRDLKTWPRRLRARHVGVLPQSSALSFPFRVEEVVAIGATPLSLTARQVQEQSWYWMQVTDTLPFAKRLYTSLSGGERQRVQLARVLLQLSAAEQPPLLLLDEPTSAQDLGQQHHLLALIKQLSHEKGFIVMAILHDLNQAIRYADKICLLHEGKMVMSGSAEATLDAATVARIWGYHPETLNTEDGRQVLV